MEELVEQTTLWKYEDASGGMEPSDSTIRSTSLTSQLPLEEPFVETSKEENQQNPSNGT